MDESSDAILQKEPNQHVLPTLLGANEPPAAHEVKEGHDQGRDQEFRSSPCEREVCKDLLSPTVVQGCSPLTNSSPEAAEAEHAAPNQASRKSHCPSASSVLSTTTVGSSSSAIIFDSSSENCSWSRIKSQRRKTAKLQALKDVQPWLESHGFTGVNSKRWIKFQLRSPLHLAVLHNDLAIIQLLLKAGAEAGTVDSAGRTPLDLARNKNGRATVIAALAIKTPRSRASSKHSLY